MTNFKKAIKESKYSAKQIADYFIYLSSQKIIDEGTSEGITPLKLQKLLYFGQAAYLSIFNKKLFKDQIEAWKFGPVVSLVYQQYKLKQNLPIKKASGEFKKLDEDTIKFTEAVWKLFDKYSASELVTIVHQHAPWKDYYKEGKNVIIPPEAMRDYYKDVFEFSEEDD